MKDSELNQWREAFQEMMSEDPHSINDEELSGLLLKDEKNEIDAAKLEDLCQNPENVLKIKTALAIKREMGELPGNPKKGNWFQWMSLAAVVFLATIGVWTLTLQDAQTVRFDRFQDDGVTRDQNQDLIVSPAVGRVFVAPPVELAIDLEVTDGTVFQFVLLSHDGSIVWESNKILQPTVQLTEQVRSLLKSGNYLWYVDYDYSEKKHRFGPFVFTVK